MRTKELLQAIYDTLKGMAENQVKCEERLKRISEQVASMHVGIQDAIKAGNAAAEEICVNTSKIAENTAPIEWPDEDELSVKPSEHDVIQGIVSDPAQNPIGRKTYSDWFLEAASSVYDREGYAGLKKYVAIEFPTEDLQKKVKAVREAIRIYKKRTV